MTVAAQEIFSKPVIRELERLGFTQFTEIQYKAIPFIRDGSNVLLIAPTGTGKTEAAILPVFDAFLQKRAAGDPLTGISILYVTPLRSLNRDILRRLVETGANLGIAVEVRHGDTPQSERVKQARKPPNMLITTPETLQAVLVGRKMREHLKGIRWVVVDEIHELASNKRGAQLALALERLSLISGRNFQRIGLSATVGNSELIGKFLAGTNRKIEIVKTDYYREITAHVESPQTTKEDEATAESLMVPSGVISRLRRILEFVDQYRTLLVFTNTREHAESLGSKIRLIAPGRKIGIHHGSLSKEVRIETEQQLKSGALKAVICTSSLELGIDIGLIDFVVQYMSPRQATKLVQRIGRSGHIISAKPKGAIISGWPDDILESAVIMKRALNGELEEPEIHFNALDVLAHQLIGLLLDHGALDFNQLFSIVTRAFPFQQLTLEELVSTLNQLESERKIKIFENIARVSPTASRVYYFESMSMIPDVKQFTVFDFISRRRVGVLDQEFVARNGKPGKQFILHGNVWQILNVDEDKNIVEVENVEPSLAAIPGWEGEIIPVPYEVAQEVGRLRREIAESGERGHNVQLPLANYNLDDASRGKVVSAVKKQFEDGFSIPSDKQIIIESFENYTIIHCCLGDKVNQTLSRIFASIITAKTGVEVAIQSDPYRIALITPYPFDSTFVRNELMSLKPEDVQKVLESTLDQTNLFMWRMWHNAKRFGVVSKTADYKLSYARTLLAALKGTPVYRETFREIYLENFDIKNLTAIIKQIHEGSVKVIIEPAKTSVSPFSLPLLDKIAPHDLIQPVKERSEVVTLLKERLENKTLKLVCAFKGDWEGTRTVRSLGDKISCPKCKSTLVAAVFKDDNETGEVIRKKLSARKLTVDEAKLYATAWKNASLVQNYGKRGAIALAARGIGPTTAIRVLHKQYRSEEEFYLAILKAERDYLRTKMFWD